MTDPAIQVVVFTMGPTLETGVKKFLTRLEDHPEISLLAVYAQATGPGLRAVLEDLWKRRGLLAVPLFLQRLLDTSVQFLSSPGRQMSLRRKVSQLAERTHLVTDIHADAVLQQLRDLAPDLGLIYGSPILKPSLFEIPSLGTLGIHHGKVPAYRGKKTTFWAMFNGEETAGVTIQRVNERLDGGELVRTGEVEIGRRPLWIVWRNLEALGLDLYLEAILEVQKGTAVYRPQTGKKGTLYRDPSFRDILAFWRKYLGRLVRGTTE